MKRLLSVADELIGAGRFLPLACHHHIDALAVALTAKKSPTPSRTGHSAAVARIVARRIKWPIMSG
jgi:hypothetical protein